MYIVNVDIDILLTLFRNCVNAQQMEVLHVHVKGNVYVIRAVAHKTSGAGNISLLYFLL